MRTRCLEQRGTWTVTVAIGTALALCATVQAQPLKAKKPADEAATAAALRMGPVGQEWWRTIPDSSNTVFAPPLDDSSAEGAVASARASNCCPIGGWVQPLGFNPVWQGNVFSIIEPVLLKKIEIEASFSGPLDITFGIYREKLNAPVGDYTAQRIKQVTLTGNGRAFYSSGTLGTGGVLLMPLEENGVPVTTFFAVGVGWGNASIDSRIDSVNYSSGPAFCAGRVWGSWARIGMNPPAPGGLGSDELLGLQFFPTGVISMNLCFEVPGGACCLGDTTCVDDVTSNACVTELGGDFLGLFTLCALDADQCIGFGACCSPGGNCSVSSAADCMGTYKGDGTECDPLVDPCSSNLGGCCRYDGDCTDTNEYDCELDPRDDTPGTWLGDGVECDGVGGEPNCEPLGACCDGIDTCTDVPVDQCEVNQCINALDTNGTCLPTFEFDSNGVCPDVGQPQCFRPTGLTYSEGQPCMFDPCKSDDNLGACCVLGACSVDTQLDCENMGGFFTELGTNGAAASSNGWQACDIQTTGFCEAGLNEGACCLLPTDECVVRTDTRCATTNGVFQGFGLACSAFLCDDGACCHTNMMGEPDCEEVPPLECAATDGFAGQFQGSGTTCPSNCFVTGACCLADTSCTPIGEAQCVSLGGMYQGDDTDCAELSCPAPGACCFDDGSCKQLFDPACMSSNGVYSGDDTDCAVVACPIPGACCANLGITLCFEESDQDCAARPVGQNAVFSAGGNCNDGCESGSCCELDRTCTETTGAACSAIADSLFTSAGDCTPNLCEDRGACCTGSGCVLATKLVCTTGLSGVYRGDAVSCSLDNVCDSAACCLANGTCVDGFITECTGIAGDPGEFCQPNLCADGACCIDFTGGGSLTCQPNLNLLECRAVQVPFSEFAGAGTTCPDACDNLTAACCKLDGSCAELTDTECAAIGGATYFLGENCASASCVDQCGASVDSDFNGDGSVDLLDYAAFQLCFGDSVSAACLCPFDANSNGVIDHPDFRAFLSRMQCAPFADFGLADFDNDGDVDLTDYSAFQQCFLPPPAIATKCDCIFDLDANGTVDLADLALLVPLVTGP